MEVSQKQRDRQHARSENGKYSKMAHCEVCNKALGWDYYSDPRCEDFGGIGLVLCAKCALKVEQMDDQTAFEFLKLKNGRGKNGV